MIYYSIIFCAAFIAATFLTHNSELLSKKYGICGFAGIALATGLSLDVIAMIMFKKMPDFTILSVEIIAIILGTALASWAKAL